jgi:lactobin A/cerein 7B family class IIb bacteriocin
MSVASLQEVSVAELAEVNGGILPLIGAIAVGVGLGALCVYWKANEPSDAKPMTNFELLGITPPK